MRQETRTYLFSMGVVFMIYSGAVSTIRYHQNREAPSLYQSAIIFGTGITGIGLIGAATLSKRDKLSKLEK